MSTTADVISRYFEHDADRDIDAIVALFSEHATVIDEAQARHGTDEIRAWQTGAASKYSYSTEIFAITGREPGRSVVDGRIAGNFPGGVADLRWEFTVSDDRIRRLVIKQRVGRSRATRSRRALAPNVRPSLPLRQSQTPQEGSPMHGTPLPTVVLVHGAFAESASWNGVIKRLKRDGYPVIAVANPLRGLQYDAAYLRSVLDRLSGPVVVAGHSYGGSVMSEAADGAPGVTALVYVASFHLEAGESTAELAAKFPGGELGPALDSVPFPFADGETGSDLYIRQDRFREVFAADVAPEVAELMAATQRPIAVSALEDTATKAAWKTIPSWTMVTRQDLAIPADSMRFMAERAGSTTIEIDASHAVTVSQPGAVADLIDTAARATATAGVGADLIEVPAG